MTRRWVAAPAAAAFLVAAFAPGCVHGLSGSYPCDPGYASCHGGGYGSDPACETNITSDPQSCGACGKTCPMGAVCAAGACSAPPTVLTTDANPAELGIDTADVFYWSTQHGAVNGLPKTGGSPYAVALPGAWGNVTAGITPFAVDDSGVYYVASNDSGTGPSTLDLSRVRSDGTSPSATVVGGFPSSSGNSGNLYGLMLSGGTVFVAGAVATSGGPSDVDIWSFPTAGGDATSISTFSSNGTVSNFVFDASNLYFVRNDGQSNSSAGCEIDRLPGGGGSPSPLVTLSNGEGCPSAIASDGTNLYWATGPTTYTDDNGDQQCSGSPISRIPVGGGATSVLTQLPDEESALTLAAGAGTVFVATGQSVWRVPGSGGTAVRIAANLGVSDQTTCCGCSASGSGGSNLVSIALDDSYVYVAIPNALLELPR